MHPSEVFVECDTSNLPAKKSGFDVSINRQRSNSTSTTTMKSLGSCLAVAIVSGTPAASAITVGSGPFALSITEITEDLGATIQVECWNKVTFKPHLDAGQTDYAWVSSSQLSQEALKVAPEGAWAYKQNFTTDLVYSKVSLVEVDAPDAALIFGEAEPFLEPYKTFAEVDAAQNLTGWRLGAQIGIKCTEADDTQDSDLYSKYAWVPVDDDPERALGAFVFQLKDGSGIVRHPDQGGSDEDGQKSDDEAGNSTSGGICRSTSAVAIIFFFLGVQQAIAYFVT